MRHSISGNNALQSGVPVVVVNVWNGDDNDDAADEDDGEDDFNNHNENNKNEVKTDEQQTN